MGRAGIPTPGLIAGATPFALTSTQCRWHLAGSSTASILRCRGTRRLPGAPPSAPKSGGNPYGKDLDKLPVGHDQGRAIDLR